MKYLIGSFTKGVETIHGVEVSVKQEEKFKEKIGIGKIRNIGINLNRKIFWSKR